MSVSEALERACAVHNEDGVRGMRERIGELTVDLVLADPPYFGPKCMERLSRTG